MWRLDVRRAQAERLARAEVDQPFGMQSGPLLRAHILRLDASEHVLLITIHHIVFDNWLQGVLVRELIALYKSNRGILTSRIIPFPPVAHSCGLRHR
jgi:condensation domain-containing protein